MGADAAVEAAAKAAGEAHGAFIRWPMNDGIDRRGIVEQRVRDAYEDALAEQPREEVLACTPDLRDVLQEVLSQRRSIEDAHAWIIEMLHQAERAVRAEPGFDPHGEQHARDLKRLHGCVCGRDFPTDGMVKLHILNPSGPQRPEEGGERRETTADEDAKAYADMRQRVIDGRASRYEAQEFIDFIEGAIPTTEQRRRAGHESRLRGGLNPLT